MADIIFPLRVDYNWDEAELNLQKSVLRCARKEVGEGLGWGREVTLESGQRVLAGYTHRLCEAALQLIFTLVGGA